MGSWTHGNPEQEKITLSQLTHGITLHPLGKTNQQVQRWNEPSSEQPPNANYRIASFSASKRWRPAIPAKRVVVQMVKPNRKSLECMRR
eukprot:scaffold270_cov347-Pavlova_lutheri.AAC.46